MADQEHITVPGYIPGDYCVRYRGPDLREQAIRTGDMLVIAKPAPDDEPEPGRLVVTKKDGKAELVKYEPGVSLIGVVTGVMRRYGDA